MVAALRAEFKTDINRVTNENMNLRQQVQRLTEQMRDVTAENQATNQHLARLAAENVAMKADIQRLTSAPSSIAPITPAEPYTQFTAMGCVNDVIELSCPDERRIITTGAIYGQYSLPCDTDCCAPQPVGDCTALVEESRPEDWLAIQLLCNNNLV